MQFPIAPGPRIAYYQYYTCTTYAVSSPQSTGPKRKDIAIYRNHESRTEPPSQRVGVTCSDRTFKSSIYVSSGNFLTVNFTILCYRSKYTLLFKAFTLLILGMFLITLLVKNLSK